MDRNNDIIIKLESLKIHKVDKLLDKLFSSNSLDRRMRICDDILTELEYNGIDVIDIEDDIKELTLR